MNLRTVTAPDELDALYEAVLMPSFPPSELVERSWLIEGVTQGSVIATAVDDGEGPTALAVTEVVCPGVVLLSYLAALPQARGAGVGSRLLTHVREQASQHHVALLLAEVERPDRHPGSAAYGDPAARLRFYARHGAQVLDLPYVQPPIRPGADAVPGMLLLALEIEASRLREAGTAVEGGLVAQAIEAMLGEGAHDDHVLTDLRAAARADHIGLRPAADWRAISGSA